MRAIIIDQFGDPSVLKLTTMERPAPAPDEVLVKVKAISINPVDVKTRAGSGVAGRLKGLMPIILGWDISGTIVESQSKDFQPGDDVFGMVNFPGYGKAYAEYVVVPADQIALKPANISHEKAAAATLAALTAWQAFHKHSQLKEGDKVLIHAASGGVGHFAVQLAKAAGAYVIGTSSAENKDFVMGLGADEHFDYKKGNFEDYYHDLDFILDTVGQDYVSRSIPVLKKGGTLISIPGSISEADQKKALEAGITAANILVHSNGSDMRQLAELLSSSKLKSYITKVFPFENMADAHLQLESHRTVGKVVLTL